MIGTIKEYGIVICSEDEFLITGFTFVGYASVQEASFAALQWAAGKIQDEIEHINSLGIGNVENASLWALLNHFEKEN